ncbi:chondroitin sulfate/heparin utilization regulation protein [Psychromonas sp. CNPT3]|uniref:anaerobic sulfatase maturase n=1 Tax=Psychromonas sp. CNPT3 TaxID=314282 RepID=UPI00006E4883|nr:anaerobic sulfatase maturase [Psychromonas sp. CNPT3]AGH80938.1 chondroitin sulfate/heparin utilization regulation protein [Psychromonas sp. CNPT3]
MADNVQPVAFHMMAKPSSFHCNLKCDYCFYLEKDGVVNETSETKNSSSDNMSNGMLERYIEDYIHSHQGDDVDFSWQGGEPTLAGLDFYRRAVKYQQKHAQGKTITNSFQTNAVAINRQWARFFAQNKFLIGVSIEGIAEVHDKYRISVNGKPTFERVKRAIELLKEYKVEFNTLTVINDQNWQRGKETYIALKALGATHMQFIPIVEVQASCQDLKAAHYSPHKDVKFAPFSVPAEGYGLFMMDVFNEWVQKDVGNVFVRMFDSILAGWMGYPASTCVQSYECGQAMVIEANGDVYSCDHYVYPANKLGNIKQINLAKMASSEQQKTFGVAKSKELTQNCEQCDVYRLCYGGCPKHRLITLPGEQYKHNYLCASYKKIFNQTAPAMHMMSQAIEQGGMAMDAMPMINKHLYQDASGTKSVS